jgi:hypothetical protein
MTDVIDLDALESDAAFSVTCGYRYVTSTNPHHVLALVAAVRAGEAYKTALLRYQHDRGDLTRFYDFVRAARDYRKALAPFRTGGAS